MLKLIEFSHNHQDFLVKMVAKNFRRRISVLFLCNNPIIKIKHKIANANISVIITSVYPILI